MFFFFQAEDGIRDDLVTGVQTCALPISPFPDARDPGSPFFAGNLFFEPTAEPLSEEAATLWDDALAAGWSILVAGAGKGAGTVRETIAAEILTLRARVRGRLFEGAP